MRPSPGGVSDEAFSRTLPGAAFGLDFLPTFIPSGGVRLAPERELICLVEQLDRPA